MLHRRAEYIFIFIYVFFAWLFGRYTVSFLNGSDAIQYISIAEKIADGNFALATNAYWSPLISFLMAPLFWIFKNGLLNFTIINVICGAVSLVLLSRITGTYIKNNWFWFLLMGFFLLAILSFALLYFTPDLLCLTLLLFYFRLVVQNDFFRNAKLIGITGGLLYLAKAYCFYFFIVHALVLLLNNRKQKENVRAGITLFLSFVIVAGTWVAVLSFNKNKFTIGESGTYNLSLINPENRPSADAQLSHPFFENKLIPVQKEHSYTAWEYPGDVLYSPIRLSPENLGFYLKEIKNNGLSFYYYVVKRNIGVLFFIMTFIYVLLAGYRRVFKEYGTVLLFMSIYLSGYLLVFIHLRYIWVVYLLLFILCFSLIERILNQTLPVLREWQKKISFLTALNFGVCVLAFYLCKKPIKELFLKYDRDISADLFFNSMLHPFKTLEHTYQYDRNLVLAFKKIPTGLIEGKNIAGIYTDPMDDYKYNRNLQMAYVCKARFSGELFYDKNTEDIILEMKKNKTDYLIDWNNTIRLPEANKVIYHDEKVKLKIYQLN